MTDDKIQEPFEPDTEQDQPVEPENNTNGAEGQDAGTTEEANGDTSSELERLKKENEGLKDSLKRQQAEFENFRKRTEREREEQSKCATQDLLHKILPVMDNIDLAMNNSHDTDEFVKGTTLIFEQLKNVLESEGLEEIKAEGETFDPRLHQALLTEDSDQENKVLQVMQKGYMLNDKVLRHAKVKVGKKPLPQDAENNDDSGAEQEDDGERSA